MPTWLDERVSEVRQRLTTGDEASLWLLLFDDPSAAPVLAPVIEDAMSHMDADMARSVAIVINGVPAKAVLLAVPRRTGSPCRADRQLWLDLQHLVREPPELLDLIVVGDTEYWSARGATA
ncbi:MAG: hypothetical protein M3P23_09640 [Actinomycetota bacterium]|nr:hypothetical protein [Actinomycetota bacterium]